jgi:hypothetical protein
MPCDAVATGDLLLSAITMIASARREKRTAIKHAIRDAVPVAMLA